MPSSKPLPSQSETGVTHDELTLLREQKVELLEALREIAKRGPVPGYRTAGALLLRLVATQSIARAAITKATR